MTGGSEQLPAPRAATRLLGLLDSAVYAGVWLGTNAVFRPYFRLGADNLPRLDGPFVLVANHSSFLDPIFLLAVLRRRVAFLMSEIFFRSPRSRWFFRWGRVIPVAARGGNREAIRAARDALQRGEIVGVFPEGGLSRDGQLYLGHPGAVSLVLSAGVPVVPAGLIGAHEAYNIETSFPRPKRVRVHFGAPIPAGELAGSRRDSRKQRLRYATVRIMREIAELSGQTPREAQLRYGVDGAARAD